MYIANNIKYLRVLRGYDQGYLAKELGVLRTAISNYENGVSEPSIERLLKIAKILDVNVGDLIAIDMSAMPNILAEDFKKNVDFNTDEDWEQKANGKAIENLEIIASVKQSKTPFYSLPVSAGERGIIEWYQETPQGYFIDIPALSRAEAAFPISGFSMEPEIRNGDVVGVREMQSWDYVDTAGVYMLITQEERMIKRLKPDEEDDNLFWCLSNNYAPFKLRKTDILRLFKVVACVSVL